jgi:CRP-like cAMP-binding protein
MAIDALVKPFLALPLFRGLKPIQLTEIVRCADRIVYQPGEALIEEDQSGDAAIIIISGEAIRLHQSDESSQPEPVIEGSMLGELAMLVETIYTSTVIARSTVRALRITRTDMHALMQQDLSLAEHMTSQITARLKRLALELQSVDDALAQVANIDQIATQMANTNYRSPLIH